MAEHLDSQQRDTLAQSLRVMLDYVLDWATDADVFALHAILGNQTAQMAQRLERQGYDASFQPEMAQRQSAQLAPVPQEAMHG